jgi:hypothetical protein
VGGPRIATEFEDLDGDGKQDLVVLSQTTDCLAAFADFNADGRNDMFLACGGWDTVNGPGEQNRLYLSRPEGGWRDVTDTLPQLSDRTISSQGRQPLSITGLLTTKPYRATTALSVWTPPRRYASDLLS